MVTNKYPKKPNLFGSMLRQRSNWRIVQLPNGYLPNRARFGKIPGKMLLVRETIEPVLNPRLISSVEHYTLIKLEFVKGPKVVSKHSSNTNLI